MKGYVHVYTGDGKGKTTAAVGLAVRAAGAGLRVFIGQFIKGRDSCEIELLRQRCPEITVEQFGTGCFVRGEPEQEDIDAALRGLERLSQAVSCGDYDVVIADEANGAVRSGVCGIEAMLELVDRRRPEVELIFTGRDARPELIARADLVTEMCKIRHYFDADVPARKGIEL